MQFHYAFYYFRACSGFFYGQFKYSLIEKSIALHKFATKLYPNVTLLIAAIQTCEAQSSLVIYEVAVKIFFQKH